MASSRRICRSAAPCALALTLAAAGAAQVIPPEGDNFLINETVAGLQSRPSAALLDTAGNSIVVWTGPNNHRIFGRCLDVDGMPLGGEFQIGGSETEQTFDPDVASDLAGNAVVVWTRIHQGSPTIRGRFLTSCGQPPGVGEFGAANGERASVARDATGEWVVAYQHTSMDIRISRYDTEGTLLAGRNVTPPLGSEARPDVALHVLSGTAMVVWEEPISPQDPSDPSRIMARLYDSDLVPQGDPFQVDDITDGEQSRPSIATDIEGNFLVVWDGEGGFGRNISVKRYDPNGTALGTEFQIGPFNRVNDPTVAVGDLEGNFMVAFEKERGGTEVPEVRARWFAHNFDQEGAPQVGDFAVSSGAEDQTKPTILGDLQGNFVVAWEGRGTLDPDGGILAQRYVAPVMLQINDLSIIEGDPLETTATFTVRASKEHPLEQDVTVDFQTFDGTATFVEDYTLTVGSLTFGPGSPLSQPVSVPVVEDTIFEADETFFVDLDDVTNAVITRQRGLATIENDDLPGDLTITDVQGLEGDAGVTPFVFTVSLTPAQQTDASVSFATEDGTATAGSDYQATSGLLTIPAGFTDGFVTVNVLGDTAIEGDEDFLLRLSDPSDARLIDDVGVGTILTDEPCLTAPTIDPMSAQFPVAGGDGMVTVTDPEACGWEATSNDPWITGVTPPTGVGDGTVSYHVQANPELFPRLGTITVADLEFTVRQDGTLCDYTVVPSQATFPSAGGSGTVSVTANEPICPWTAAPPQGWITILESPDCPPGSDPSCPHGGTGNGSLVYEVAQNDGPDREDSLIVAAQVVAVSQSGIFFDHFDDGVVSSEWHYNDAQFWSEADSFLAVDPTGQGAGTAIAIARPAFTGCVEGTIRTTARFDLFSTGTLTVYGWYINEDTHVSLTADEFANRWTLTQRIAGVDVQSVQNDSQPIVVHQLYDVEIGFDGATFTVLVDGAVLLTMPAAAGSTPDGTVGFGVDRTTASFDLIDVLTVTSGNLPASVLITEPADGATLVAAVPTTFAGNAIDPEDGDLTAALEWTSSLDGVIGHGGSFTAQLSVGDHLITAAVTDSGGLPALMSIDLTVIPDEPPVVEITAPADGSTFADGDPIDFAGTAIDLVDGDLTAALEWTSSLDGVIGHGGSFTAQLSIGSHLVTAMVIDSGGLTGSDSIAVTVTEARIFSDDFETGDTGGWSATVPD